MQLLEPIYLSIETLHNQFIKTKATDEAYRNIGVLYDKRKFNLSQVMYENVQKIFAGRKGYNIYTSNFNPSHRPLLDNLILLFYNQKDLASRSLERQAFDTTRYLDWLRNNNYPMPLSLKNARNTYIFYSEYLRNRIRLGDANHDIRRKQNFVLQFLTLMYPDKSKHIAERIPKIHATDLTGKITKQCTTVKEEDINYALAYYFRFFHQVTDFLLENKPFPNPIKLISFNATLTPFTFGQVLLENHTKGHRAKLLRQLNLHEGRFLNDHEILQVLEEEDGWSTLYDREKKEKYNKSKKRRNKYISECENANNDTTHISRMKLGALAQRAFFMLFAGVTGQNDSVIATLEWGEDDLFSLEKTSKGFVTIKPRANYKQIDFSIQRLLLNSFRKYLKLRRYLLNGYECNSLFFMGFGKDAKLTNILKDGSYGNSICYDAHKKIDPNLPPIMTRKFRVYKNKWVLSYVNGDYWIASEIAGNTPRINAIHYHGKSPQEINNEISSFVDLMAKKIKSYDKISENSSRGKCDDFQNPSPDSDHVLLEPDCNNWYYCFFCKHYGIYPNNEDIHKLISLKYIIERISSSRAKNEIHFKQIMGPVLERIIMLLEIMAKKYDSEILIREITIKVYCHQELHWYWDLKLNQLWKMGAL